MYMCLTNTSTCTKYELIQIGGFVVCLHQESLWRFLLIKTRQICIEILFNISCYFANKHENDEISNTIISHLIKLRIKSASLMNDNTFMKHTP